MVRKLGKGPFCGAQGFPRLSWGALVSPFIFSTLSQAPYLSFLSWTRFWILDILLRRLIPNKYVKYTCSCFGGGGQKWLAEHSKLRLFKLNISKNSNTMCLRYTVKWGKTLDLEAIESVQSLLCRLADPSVNKTKWSSPTTCQGYVSGLGTMSSWKSIQRQTTHYYFPIHFRVHVVLNDKCKLALCHKILTYL